jgi:hypothetical protein
MKSLQCGAVLIIAVLLLSCGNDHPKLMSIAVSPATATVSTGNSMPAMNMPSMTFVAMGKFSNGSTRQLSQADGLKWVSANTMVATVDMNGVATCVAAGVVTITAQVPVNVTMMVGGMSAQPTASTMSGTASLTCM